MAKINLIGLYQQAFGGIFTAPNTTPVVLSADKLDQLTTSLDTSARTSFIGTKLFMPCKLDGIELPNEPIIEITGSKTIIKTNINGRDGSFKEEFSLNDYSITIRGIAINDADPDSYPEAIVRDLRLLCEKRGSLEISNLLTSYFGITRFSIESFRFPTIEGALGMQPYEFSGFSDKTFKLEF